MSLVTRLLRVCVRDLPVECGYIGEHGSGGPWIRRECSDVSRRPRWRLCVGHMKRSTHESRPWESDTLLAGMRRLPESSLREAIEIQQRSARVSEPTTS